VSTGEHVERAQLFEAARPLVLTPPEVNAMRRLSAFLETPRAAKRLINVYRLLKCITGPEATVSLQSGEDFTVLLQLALLCGLPEEARQVFEQLQYSARESLWEAVEDLKKSAAPPVGGGPSAPIAQALDAMLSLKSTGEVTTRSWKYWAPLTARFAFLRPDL
jgi:hypothetical protein